MSNKMIVYSVGIIVAVLFLLYACSKREDLPDLHRYIKTVKLTEMGMQKKVSVINIDVPAPVTYKADALPVPFTQTNVVPASALSVKQVSSPLQAYPLSVLRFVGTFSRGGVIFAYIAAPDGMVYEAKEGDVIGDQNTKIVHIESDRLSIEQVSQSGVLSTNILELKEDQP